VREVLRRHWPLLILLALVLGACAAGTNEAVDVADAGGDTAGFFLGFWHGLILPVTFVISLFTDNVSIYEVHNTGNWYDFGYVFAVMAFVGGGCSARR
jgi:hypothetical protein